MKWRWWQVGLAAKIAWGLSACSGPAADPHLEPETPDLSQLSVAEVTTITTVQASSGIFLSPRPQQQRPAYVERGEAADARSGEPTAQLDRAKVDTALLFHAANRSGLRFDATLGAVDPQHFFPALSEGRWPIVLGNAAAPDRDAWSEWGGWRAYAGLAVEDAPAATLDYESLGMQSPLVLSAEGEDIVVTNRSHQTIGKTMLVYSHADGVGISFVESLGPGMRRFTTTGPKEHNPSVLLERAREQLESFFSEVAGPELGRAMAQAKSIPCLETLGLRLIYLLDEAQVPRAVALPRGVGEHRRFVVAQAEVLAPVEEQHVVSLLQHGTLHAADVPQELGRFSQAKLESAAISDESVRAQAEQLLQTLDD